MSHHNVVQNFLKNLFCLIKSRNLSSAGSLSQMSMIAGAWASLKPGVQNSIWVSHTDGRNPNPCTIPWCLLWHTLAGSWHLNSGTHKFDMCAQNSIHTSVPTTPLGRNEKHVKLFGWILLSDAWTSVTLHLKELIHSPSCRLSHGFDSICILVTPKFAPSKLTCLLSTAKLLFNRAI